MGRPEVRWLWLGRHRVRRGWLYLRMEAFLEASVRTFGGPMPPRATIGDNLLPESSPRTLVLVSSCPPSAPPAAAPPRQWEPRCPLRSAGRTAWLRCARAQGAVRSRSSDSQGSGLSVPLCGSHHLGGFPTNPIVIKVGF